MNQGINGPVPDLGTRRVFAEEVVALQFFDGLMGLGTSPPAQFGQTLSKTPSTHAAQNVHS